MTRWDFRKLRKNPISPGEKPRGLKPALMTHDLRGPEGPLFHGNADILEFFCSLPGESFRYRRFSKLPDHLNRIAGEPGIGRDDRPSFFDTLCDEQTIKGVAMVKRQRFSPERVIECDRQNFDSIFS